LEMDKARFTLKTAREMKKMTQVEAAKLIGVSVDTLGNYERGKSYPDIQVLRKIEKTYGVPYERLIFLPLDYDKTVNII
jgi:putative transcriptional regulator